jgi:hypothetical protein
MDFEKVIQQLRDYIKVNVAPMSQTDSLYYENCHPVWAAIIDDVSIHRGQSAVTRI